MKILVIEEQENLREVVVKTLRREGHPTDFASDINEGLYKALHWNYDLITLAPAPSLARKQRYSQVRQSKETQFLMLEGINDDISLIRRENDLILRKPFTVQQLVKCISPVVDNLEQKKQPIPEVGRVQLRPASQEIFVDGEKIEATSREYAIVELLLKHRGEIVTQDFLFKKIFGNSDIPARNLLQVYIYQLRKKIGKNFVKTKRGQGYIVEA